MGRSGSPSAINHFFSEIDALERSRHSGGHLAKLPAGDLLRDFSRLIAPVIGEVPAEDLFYRTLDHIDQKKEGFLQKLGFIAAFFLGEFDDGAMTLEAEDWQEIREIIEDASEDINLATLTGLMDELLSRGLLK
jgi:hypothetical protein